MPLTKERKRSLIEKFGADEKDAGSVEVQISMLTERIRDLTKHFDRHPKDHHSRRGLVSLVSKRRRLLKYLMRRDYGGYKKLIEELGIRK
ncbi:MAG: 30S ribosomal protein S15 [Fidelibacterota bacterium]